MSVCVCVTERGERDWAFKRENTKKMKPPDNVFTMICRIYCWIVVISRPSLMNYCSQSAFYCCRHNRKYGGIVQNRHCLFKLTDLKLITKSCIIPSLIMVIHLTFMLISYNVNFCNFFKTNDQLTLFVLSRNSYNKCCSDFFKNQWPMSTEIFILFSYVLMDILNFLIFPFL